MKKQQMPRRHGRGELRSISAFLTTVRVVYHGTTTSRCLPRTMVELKEAVMQLHRDIEAQELVLASWERGIQDLPNEILADIFAEAVDGHNALKTRIALHLVCKRWHCIARNSGAVNRFIRIKHRDSWETVKTMLGLTNSYPRLCISLDISRLRHEAERQSVVQLLKDISPSMHRWRSLEVEWPPEGSAGILDHLIGPAPPLETLSVRVDTGYTVRGVGNLSTMVIPSLRSITLNGVYLPWNSQVFHTLDTLQLSNMELPDEAFMCIAQATPRLRRLICVQVFARITTSETIHFSNLEQLTLDGPYVDPLMLRLSTPSLIELALANTLLPLPYIGTPPFKLSALKSLRFTRLYRRPNAEKEIRMLLRLPNLSTWHTVGSSLETIRALSKEQSEGWICPHLCEIAISDLLGIQPEDVIQLIQARAVAAEATVDGPSPIRKLTIKAGTYSELFSKSWDLAKQQLEYELIEECSLLQRVQQEYSEVTPSIDPFDLFL